MAQFRDQCCYCCHNNSWLTDGHLIRVKGGLYVHISAMSD